MQLEATKPYRINLYKGIQRASNDALLRQNEVKFNDCMPSSLTRGQKTRREFRNPKKWAGKSAFQVN